MPATPSRCCCSWRVGFAAPLLAVIGFSFMPARTFGLFAAPTLANYVDDLRRQQLHLLRSGRSASRPLTVLILARDLLSDRLWPGARVRPLGDLVLTLLFTIPLFVSENVRLYGWVLFFIKNGVLLGTLKSLFGIELESIAVHAPA